MKEIWSDIKFYGYKLIYGTYFKFVIYIGTYRIRKKLHILNSEDTITKIVQAHSSICRFGDGELRMVAYYLKNGNVNTYNVDTFQQYDERLGKRLLEVLLSSTALSFKLR